MGSDVSRRWFLGSMGAGAASMAASSALAADPAASDALCKIVAVACSPRRGKTTAQALRLCLDAAQAVAPDRVEVELIELADLEIPGYMAAGLPLKPGHQDDFPQIAAKLTESHVGGVIMGTPVYFGGMTSLCKAFLDRCIALRSRSFVLANKVGGVVAVGGVRNGGQELAIQGVQMALQCQEMVVVGDGRPTAHWGATVWNSGQDDIAGDEFGVTTLRNLGRRVAEVALARHAILSGS